MRNKYTVRDYISQELDDISDGSYSSSEYECKPSSRNSNNNKNYNNTKVNKPTNTKLKNDNHIPNPKSIQSTQTTSIQSINSTHTTNDILNVIIGGPVDSGKSTLIGYILTRDSKVKSNHLAGVLDTSLEERERGITIDVKLNYSSYDLCGKLYKLLLLDTPGHCDLFTCLIKSSLIANQAILILDITKLKQHKSKSSLPLGINHAIIYNHCIKNDIIVCINKMDLVNYSESDFNSATNTLSELYKSLLKIDFNFTFIPIVANTGLNIDKSVDGIEHFSWYKGKTLFHELSERINKIKTSKDLVCHVIDQWSGNKDINLTLYIESGNIGKSTKAKALPSMLDLTLSCKTPSTAGSVVDVTIRCKDLDLLGDVIAVVRGNDIPCIAKWIDVKLSACGISNTNLNTGQTVELIIGSSSEEAYIESIKDDNDQTKYVIIPGLDYTVRFNLYNDIVVHPSTNDTNILSKVVVRYSGSIVAWGSITASGTN